MGFDRGNIFEFNTKDNRSTRKETQNMYGHVNLVVHNYIHPCSGYKIPSYMGYQLNKRMKYMLSFGFSHPTFM